MRQDIDYEYEISSAVGKVMLLENTWDSSELECIVEHLDYIVLIIKAIHQDSRDIWLKAIDSERKTYEKAPDELACFCFWVREAVTIFKIFKENLDFRYKNISIHEDAVKALSKVSKSQKFVTELMTTLILKSAHNKLISSNLKDRILKEETLVYMLGANMVEDNGAATVEYWYEENMYEWDWGKGAKEYFESTIIPKVKKLEVHTND